MQHVHDKATLNSTDTIAQRPIQTHHVDSTLKRRGNDVESTWCLCRDLIQGHPIYRVIAIFIIQTITPSSKVEGTVSAKD